MTTFNLFQENPLSPDMAYIRVKLGVGSTCSQAEFLYSETKTENCETAKTCEVHENDANLCVFKCQCDSTQCKVSSGIVNDVTALSICDLDVM